MDDNHGMYERRVLKRLRAALGDSPVVLLHGARQVGKTTLVRDLLGGGGRRYITLDGSAALAAATGDPDGFIAGLEGPVAIDEVQRAPELFRAIKASVDRDRRPGRFLLTGSANVLALPRLSESLAGRVDITPLWPLSQSEIEGVEGSFIDRVFERSMGSVDEKRVPRRAIFDRVARGGFPEALSRKDVERRGAWFDAYVTTILQRDVRDLANIEDLASLPVLLRLLATRTSGLLNYADLSRSVGLAQTTLKRYFAALEATFMVHLVRPWATNLGTRLVKSPKVHLIDTGLAAYLVGQPDLPDGSAMLGAMLESFVVTEMLKQSGWSKTRVEVFHFRTQTGREVDIVLEDRKGRLVGIEVKSSASVDGSDFAGLRTLAEMVPDRFVRGIVLHTGAEMVPFGKNLVAMPVGALWGGGRAGVRS